MKKIILIILACVFMLCCFGCSNKNSNSNSNNQSLSQISTKSSKVDNSNNSQVIKSENSKVDSVNKSSVYSSLVEKSNSVNSSSAQVQLPTNVESVINSSVSATKLITNDKVSGNYLILPRVSNDGLCYISWQSKNQNIIDNNGVVYQTNKLEKVTLTATYYYQQYSKNVDYSVEVEPIKGESLNVTLNDGRILNKIYVSSVSELQSAFSSAKAGDAIVLNDGSYNNVNLTLSKNGTNSNPIFIIAKNSQKAIITGESALKISGDNVIVCGLSFENGAPKEDKGCVIFSGDYCRLTNCKIYNYCNSNLYKWVSLSGKYNEVDHNVFDGKSVGGALLTVWRNDDSTQHHFIHHNAFKNYASGGGENGYETIRIGDSKQSQSDSYTIIENNYFEACNGEVEAVSVKSGRNLIKNNTFVSCEGLVTFRHGKNNVAINNVFLCNNTANSGGIRAYDGGHAIINNYVEGQRSTSNTRGGIVLHSGVNKVFETPTINAQWTAYNCLVKNNSLIECQQTIMFCGKYEFACKDITVENNLIYNSNNGGVRINKAFDGLNSSGNVAYCKSLFTTNSTIFEMSGVKLNDYVILQRENNFIVANGVGANGMVAITENQVGNY